MSSIGSVLKDARAKNSVSYEEVYAKIKIHPRVLQLLEENKFDKLPSPLFAKSFIRSYAEFLGVNADELVQTYEREAKKDPEQILFIRPAEGRRPFHLRSLLFPFFVAVCAAVAFYGFKTALVWWPHAGKPAVSKAKAGSKAEGAAAGPRQSAEWLRSVADGSFPEIGRQVPLELKVTAVDNVWLRVTADGKIVFQSILKRGAVQIWTARGSFEIWTGNSSNMALSVNHYMLGSPGRGVVKRMVIDRHGVRITQ